jgi:uncharacterized phage protein gp47/JayE
MATLQTYTLSALASNIATAIQGAATALLDFTVGSVLLAITQAVSGVVLWLQAIILQLLTVTRAATSVGSDVDSWMADYNFTRLPAVAATGQVTFSRFTATQQAVVPVGATVQSSDGTQNFTVLLDTTNSAYSASLGGYVLPANTASVTVTVQDTVGGTGGNVQAAAIGVITTPIPGVDTVTNASAFTNGINAETDPAFRARFMLYLASLSKGTKAAVAYAITGVQQGLNYTITENQDYNGATDDGLFYVVVDDGSGSPSSTLLNNISSAIDAVRALTIRFAVFGPSVETANVSLTITSVSGYIHSIVVGAVGTAITNFINSLTLGVSLPYTQLAAIAYGVPGVQNASSVLLNSGTSDLAANKKQLIKAGTVTVA